ncbi:FadR/GntR family transcriptional regulator [Falsigemmobacter faecalis]|uniref:FadR family transcriptional regulator n=1 Tax=Falsigemmobacter faecalis TaxID=2488730 RepID=A0A3P3DZB1_9RHOB|nr:FCD domain-containing protein [Falsigemmobacter faecalis]RRH78188.1 FadR family transcriptional regulator [Falsigemmobacter faecalis]
MIEINKVNVIPAYQMVSMELQRLIVEGTIKPGEALPGETDLAARFGVNRSTVREGIRQLESEGLVRRAGRKKLLISIPGQADISPRVERALLLQDVTFGELWEMAIVLEPLTAARAAERATSEQIQELEDNMVLLEAAVANGTRSEDIDTRFHTLLAQCTGNRALLLSREPIGQLLFRPYVELSPHVPQAPARNLRAHKEILAAIIARDSDQAKHWMERHIRDLRTGWEMAGRRMADRISPT